MSKKRLCLVPILIALFVFTNYAYAFVTARNYGYKLGHMTPPYGTVTGADYVWWNNNGYWSVGPWKVYFNDKTDQHGTAVNFALTTSNVNNGYLVVGNDQWAAWVSEFGGDYNTVISQLQYSSIRTPSGYYNFAKLSDIASICGWRVQSWDAWGEWAVYERIPGPPLPTPTPTPTTEPVNQPPVAKYSWPTRVYEGDSVTVTENSTDPDGEVVDWRWRFDNSTGVASSLGQGGGTVAFANSGTYNLKLTVTDDQGLTGSVTHSITVNKPVPAAVIDYGGSLKENRKVTLDSSSSTSPMLFPIDSSLDEWTITPVSGGAAADIKLGTKSGTKRDILFKKAGIYKVGLRVHNSKYPSEWAYKDIVIVPDDPPIANFTVSAVIFRNPADQSYASIKPVDKSLSLDGDLISQRIWKYKFDSNNDGSFLDETFCILDSGNNTSPILRTNKVGKYLFELEVKEAFGQETIASFIADSDYKRSDTTTKLQVDKTTDVLNIAPVTSFTSTVKQKVDIVFSQGFLTNYNTRFPQMVNNLNSIVGSKLQAKNFDYVFYNTEVRGGGTEWIVRESHGPWGPDNINSDGDGYYIKKRVFDLGKSINASDITNGWFSFDGYCPARDTTNWSVAVSNDNVTWYTIYNWVSPPKPSYWRPSQTVSITPASIPIPSFRYIKAFIHPSDYALDNFTVNVFFNSTNSSINLSNSTQQSATILDLGKIISTNTLTEYRLQFQGSGAGTYTLSVSPDNVTWTTVSSWYCKKATNLTYVWEWRYIPKSSITIPNFRYCKLSGSGPLINYMQQIVTYTSGTRATLSDIQTQAGQPFRSGAIKYVVSLAEEPYTDASSSMYTQTANTLKANNAKFVAFTNSSSLSSVQQLTSQLTDQTILTTTTDLSVPLSQLADYIINTGSPAPLSNLITLLLDQSLSYTPTYSDYEKDPKYVDNWYYFHSPTYVDNNNGTSFYNLKTLTDPVSTFDKYGKYDVYYKAMDNPVNGDLRFSNYMLWSDPAPTTVIVHRKPIANFSVQAGTLNIIDLSYDPDFQYKRPDKGVIEWYWKWKRTADSTWTVGAPSGIAAPGSYDIYLRVKDCYNVWSEPVQKTINVIDPNRPPVASFTWTPTLIYEGDTVNLINQSFDPDSDPITYQWSVFNPAGTTTGYTTKNISLNKVLPGTYWITLRVWDNHNNSGVTTKSFAVNVLNITGYVKHTPEWNTNRITYNRSKTGLDDSPRGYSVFWAGESFVPEAATTDTASSATKAQHLTVEMLGSGYNASLSGNAGKTYWTGNMWRDSFENISDGTYTFRFKVTYSNGVVKTDDVSIIISGSWQDYFKFHRNL